MRLNFWSPNRTIQTFEFQISMYFFAVCFWLFVTRLIIDIIEMFDSCNFINGCNLVIELYKLSKLLGSRCRIIHILVTVND